MRACIQIGHKDSKQWGPGAKHEVETTTMLEPPLRKRLEEYVEVVTYGGDLPQRRDFDAVVSLHCDASSNPSASGWSMGYRETTNPGSRRLSQFLRAHYGVICGLPQRADNYTPGLAGYYGYRLLQPAPFVLLELGFVSNPAERKHIQAHATPFAGAIADGILEFLGVDKTVEGEAMGNFYNQVGKEHIIGDLFVGGNNYWIEIFNPGDSPARVTYGVAARAGGGYSEELRLLPTLNPIPPRTSWSEAVYVNKREGFLVGRADHAVTLTVSGSANLNVAIREVPRV